ncbi:hypothetical protein HWV62_45563 [Athelia sp. TMB]|nr:hypothetical protein HWV62_45563 [Athelia sp. TMB]
MSRVRSQSVAEIFKLWNEIGPVEQVMMAVKHHVPEWLPLGYAAICKRPEPIEVEEALKLGLETTVKLAKAREGIRGAIGRSSELRSTSSHLFDEDLVAMIIDDIFWPTPISPTSDLTDVKVIGEFSVTRPNAEEMESAQPTSSPHILPIEPFTEVSPPRSPQTLLPDSSSESQDFKYPIEEALDLRGQSLSPLGSPEHKESSIQPEPSHVSLNPFAPTFELTRNLITDSRAPSAPNEGAIAHYQERPTSKAASGGQKKGKKWKGKKPSLSVAGPVAALPPHLQIGEPPRNPGPKHSNVLLTKLEALQLISEATRIRDETKRCRFLLKVWMKSVAPFAAPDAYSPTATSCAYEGAQCLLSTIVVFTGLNLYHNPDSKIASPLTSAWRTIWPWFKITLANAIRSRDVWNKTGQEPFWDLQTRCLGVIQLYTMLGPSSELFKIFINTPDMMSMIAQMWVQEIRGINRLYDFRASILPQYLAVELDPGHLLTKEIVKVCEGHTDQVADLVFRRMKANLRMAHPELDDLAREVAYLAAHTLDTHSPLHAHFSPVPFDSHDPRDT